MFVAGFGASLVDAVVVSPVPTDKLDGVVVEWSKKRNPGIRFPSETATICAPISLVDSTVAPSLSPLLRLLSRVEAAARRKGWMKISSVCCVQLCILLRVYDI